MAAERADESTPSEALGEEFARALAAKDFARIGELVHPEVDFRGLTSKRHWEVGDASSLVSMEYPEAAQVVRIDAVPRDVEASQRVPGGDAGRLARRCWVPATVRISGALERSDPIPRRLRCLVGAPQFGGDWSVADF